MQKLGKVYIKVDGALLESMPGATLDIGGEVRSTVVGGNRVLGYAALPKQARLECEIAVGKDTSLEDLRQITNATLTFETDVGQQYVLRNAWLTDPPVMRDGEGGRVPLHFECEVAEEIA